MDTIQADQAGRNSPHGPPRFGLFRRNLGSGSNRACLYWPGVIRWRHRAGDRPCPFRPCFGVFSGRRPSQGTRTAACDVASSSVESSSTERLHLTYWLQPISGPPDALAKAMVGPIVASPRCAHANCCKNRDMHRGPWQFPRCAASLSVFFFHLCLSASLMAPVSPRPRL